MPSVAQMPTSLLTVMVGTILGGAMIAALAIALSLVLTGNFLFEAEIQNTDVEAVTPYFGAVAITILGTAALVTIELSAWLWLRRRL